MTAGDRPVQVPSCNSEARKRLNDAIFAPAAVRLETVEEVLSTEPWGTWERRVEGSDVASRRLHLEVDANNRVLVHEAVLEQLLTDAGWIRTEPDQVEGDL